jgi:hypothetical protein
MRAMADASNLRPWLRSLHYQDLYGLIADQVPKGARVVDLGYGEGDLLALLERMPAFGSHKEIIFVDGGGAGDGDPPWVPVYQRTTNAG